MQPTEAAFLRIDEDHLAVGLGPFTDHAAPPTGRPAFYLNDFALSDPRPWKAPAEFHLARDLGAWIEPLPAPEVRWSEVVIDAFAEVYHDALHAFRNGAGLRKIVPVVTQLGRMRAGAEPLAWARHVAETSRSPLWSYGYWHSDTGFVGASPERLLSVAEGRLETMALAGTAKISGEADFAHDPKQIREHEFVVEHLLEALRDLGSVERDARRILRLEDIVHFSSRLTVRPRRRWDLNDLIRRLHPTPAVGAFPRTESTSSILRRCRALLHAPDYFGAPFGLWREGAFHSVVAIRGLAWRDRQVYLPTGCGLVAESSLETEWQELALKRRVVKSALGLA